MKKYKPRPHRYNGSGCRRCNGFIALDPNSYSLESYTKEVFCFNCGDRWWIPYYDLDKATEYQGAREPSKPPLFEPWQIAQRIIDASELKKLKGGRGARGLYKKRNA